MFNQTINDYKNLFNSVFNPFHSLFFPHQWLKRIIYYNFFNKIESNPLTKKQRQSIILDEKRNLIIAGAGTGKTSTIIGKVGYLIKSRKCENSDILILAYNRSAAAELQERIKEKIGVYIEVGTFHSIGKKIIKDTNYPSNPSEFIDQNKKFDNFLSFILDQALQNKETQNLYSLYFLEHEISYKDEHKDFKTFHEYSNWVRTNYLLTLNQEKVKSYGELIIANYLFSNGIPYVYEKDYVPNNSLKINNFYKPDFYLPEVNLYIEYFGIDEYGNTAPYIDKEKYKEQMNWKLNTHELGGTKLISLYYHQNRDRTLLKELKIALNNYKVVTKKKTNEEILTQISITEKHQNFLDIFKRFLSQFKENQNEITIDSLYKKAQENERTILFIRLFEIIYEKYSNELKKRKEIDFGDMISLASKLSRNMTFFSKWKYILIDEFQDISDGRYQLIKSLLNQNITTKLFCVGDDWQAIYRFAGSDHTIMNNFKNLFGRSDIFKLDYTFRFNNKIAHTSREFISKNPYQIDKKLKTIKFKHDPQVILHWLDESTFSNVINVINYIQKHNETSNKSLQILCRYNRSKLEDLEFKKISSLWNGNVERQRTIHSAKGLEADYSIIIDVNSEKNGFPSSRENDPILNIVLSTPDKFPNSEERRLFYVAITRSREQSHLIADSTLISDFAEELETYQDNYNIKIVGNKKNNRKCPECTDGKIKETIFEDGSIFSCSNFPLCDFKLAKCFECNTHPIERKISKEGKIYAICQNEDCNHSYDVCYNCSEGILVKKKGINGEFLGCHTYQRTKCSGKKEIFIDIPSNNVANSVLKTNEVEENQYLHTKQLNEVIVKIPNNTQESKSSIKNPLILNNKQRNVLEIIYKKENGITFDELRAELNMNNTKLQGILGSITLTWRKHNNTMDRMWIIESGKYFPIKSLVKHLRNF